MKTILHINSSNFGSTGNIMLGISDIADNNDFHTYVAFPDSRSNRKKHIDNKIIISNIVERNIHLKLAYLTGFNGCFSTQGTKKFIKKIEMIKPDLIHIHNLHNCYINIGKLFKYIKKKNIPVVWTLHDCWAFTGQCSHFSKVECNKWQEGCYQCIQYKKYPEAKIDMTKLMYQLKKQWFTGVDNMILVTPSNWLCDMVNKSFLNKYPIKVINNGIDLGVFKPTKSNFRDKWNIGNRIILLGVASPWSEGKGLKIFEELAEKLEKKYQVVLVGLSDEQMRKLNSKIIGLPRTNNVQDLVEIYSTADMFINPSLEETLGLVTVEALACGTPCIVSNKTAVPEVIDSSCGVVAKNYSSNEFLELIRRFEFEQMSDKCIIRAKKFDMKNKYKEYLELYTNMIK